METIYLCIVIFLLCLAVFDLFVGVSNDAVNFLNSAIGAKVAKFRTVLIIASVGVAIGAVMSTGMMDVARHGIMKPDHYSYEEVMTIFLAVMVTDVIVLDMFNTLGMPTSTTVSMVFELLGGSTALAMVKMWNDSSLTYAGLINTDKAFQVILAIFMSVAIAFFFGMLVQWLARLVFTFHYTKHLKYTIGVFGGLSITSIAYFLIVKGLGKSALMTPDLQQWIDQHTWYVLLIFFVVFSILMQVLHWCKLNVFKIIVLFGTFSLAMAFAGNDLVNFIGTPLAGLESYLDYNAHGAGVSPDNYIVSVLAGESQLPGKQWFLIGAGVIMTVAICTSKKAHKVVETTVNLSRQDEGEEVFSSSRIARRTVRTVLNTTSTVTKFVPRSVKEWVNSRFETDGTELTEGAAFDQVRASVNLVLAGLLIVIGTTFQLPLSTTYVAFMVAMGSSLADRAWGRESAVYRITGVISVIGGWFITAGAALIVAALIASINHFGGFIAMVLVVCAVAAVIINNNRKFKKKAETEQVDTLFRQLVRSHDKAETWELLLQHVRRTQSDILNFARTTFRDISQGLMHENIRSLRQAALAIEEEKSVWKRYRRKEILGMRKIDYLLAVEKNTWFHLGCNSATQIIYGLKRMLEPCIEHVDNNFNPLPPDYVDEFIPVCNDVDRFLTAADGFITSGNFEGVDELLVEGNAIKSRISQLRHKLQDRIQQEDSNIKIALLYLSTLQETQELISISRHLVRASKRFQTQ